MTTTDQPTETPTRQPLHPAHPDAPSQPVLVADQLTGTPVWIYPSTPAPAQSPRVDPMAQRILAAGAVSPLIGYGGSLLFGAMAGATTAIGYAAACLLLAWLIRNSSGGSGQVKVNVHVNNSVRGRR